MNNYNNQINRVHLVNINGLVFGVTSMFYWKYRHRRNFSRNTAWLLRSCLRNRRILDSRFRFRFVGSPSFSFFVVSVCKSRGNVFPFNIEIYLCRERRILLSLSRKKIQIKNIKGVPLSLSLSLSRATRFFLDTVTIEFNYLRLKLPIMFKCPQCVSDFNLPVSNVANLDFLISVLSIFSLASGVSDSYFPHTFWQQFSGPRCPNF